MAQIVINEISQNYTWNIGTNSYATVALPITSCWGPGYFNPSGTSEMPSNEQVEQMLEKTVWRRFPATQAGLESFVSTYRGPASVYRLAKDNSYQMAVTLMSAGYDVLTCRICPGRNATGVMKQYGYTVDGDDYKVNGTIHFRTKYPGSFGNNIQIVVTKQKYIDSVTRENKFYWTIVTYVVDASGVRSSVENKALVFDIDNQTDAIPYYTEVESNFWEITKVDGEIIETIIGGNVPKDLVWCDPSTYTYPEEPSSDSDTDTDTDSDTDSDTDTDSEQVVTDTSDYPSTHFETWLKFGIEQKVAAAKELFPAQIGSDYDDELFTNTDTAVLPKFEEIMQPRFKWACDFQLSGASEVESVYKYVVLQSDEGIGAKITAANATMKNIWYYQEWVRTHAVGLDITGSDGKDLGGVYDLLKDKLSYNPNRVISPGWDDQDFTMYGLEQDQINDILDQDDVNTCKFPASPLHLKLMDVAYYSRCATGFIDVPKSIERKYVHIEDPNNLDDEGYVQILARVVPKGAMLETNASLFQSHCGFFAPWGQFTYVGTSAMREASPSMLALLIQRAQILNQSIQYEWALPTNRKHNLRIGKMDYTVPKKILDKWQKLEGASVNVITNIPDLGTNIWGNSTLFEVPPATYQALANLSTRYLVNAVEDLVYRCGIAITFQYNNAQAYSSFVAGVSPLLDTMKNVGAIEGYKIVMSADIDANDRINANTIIGRVILLANGVVNDIYVDLVALPAGAGIDLAAV